ncbi:hypothetical protein ACFWRV_20435 [Streptomyces sp. NPDC058576]|uniref:thiolase family protein n=1 Tax=Streptomyces sp. NPDC058576 TaxID=3346547 RepID=UPI0036584F2B
MKAADGTAVTTDDYPRTEVAEQSLAALPPRFRHDGWVTAGNGAPPSDGSANCGTQGGQLSRSVAT